MNKRIYLKFRSLVLVLFLLLSVILQANQLTLEQLLDMKKKHLITEEEFQVFKNELNGQAIFQDEIYDLNINSKLVSRTYKILRENGKTFFPIKEFFKYINFTNYKENKKEIIAYLGTSLREAKINLLDKENVILEKQEVYLEANKFSELFLKSYNFSKNEMLLRMYLSFDTPKEISELLTISQEKLLREDKEKDLVFKSQRKLFDLGYARFQLGKTFDKAAGEKRFKPDWDGSLEYQGGFLYGQITGDYDFKEQQLNTVKLEYVDLWKGHNLEFENRRSGKAREWGISFYKNKGYYELEGGQVVIKENVPIGSRVELIYMGTPIEIKDDDNGTVEFDNPLIRTDRTYTLRVYQPDGKIYEKEIKTVQDYNLQKRHEFEYKIGINENDEYSKYQTVFDVFYGVTNNLTLGFGYSRDIEELTLGREASGLEQKAKYLNNLKLDLVYGGTYNALSYVFNLSGTKTLDSFLVCNDTNSNEKVSLKKRYTYKYLNQFNYGKWKLIYEHEEYGKFYNEKNRDKVDLKYNILSNSSIGYQYEIKRYKYEQPDDKFQQITFDTNYSWNKFLFSASSAFDMNDSRNNQYTASVYYSGWERLTGRLENTWTKNGDEYETRVTLYNNNLAGFLDFSTELSYSKMEKEKVSFKFTMKLDNWFKFDTSLGDDGAQNYRVGIDRIVDLKKPLLNLDSMDNSRVKVVTFIDKNNNNVYDKDEERLPGVDISIGGDNTITTDKNGEGMFYGVGNGVTYDLDVTIKKPSFTLGNNKIKVLSNFSSTVEAYIPIKPMLSLTGSVVLDKTFDLTEEEKMELYSDLIIELKDLNGTVIETAAPDNEGIFEISGLFPKDYYIEVTYVGTKYNLKNISEEIELQYSKDNSENMVQLKISNNRIAINTSDIIKNMAMLRRN